MLAFCNIPRHMVSYFFGSFHFLFGGVHFMTGWLQSKGNYKKSSSGWCFWGGALEYGQASCFGI